MLGQACVVGRYVTLKLNAGVVLIYANFSILLDSFGCGRYVLSHYTELIP